MNTKKFQELTLNDSKKLWKSTIGDFSSIIAFYTHSKFGGFSKRTKWQFFVCNKSEVKFFIFPVFFLILNAKMSGYSWARNLRRDLGIRGVAKFFLFCFVFVSVSDFPDYSKESLLSKNAYFNRIFYQGVQRATVKILLHASVLIYRAKILVLVNEVTIPYTNITGVFSFVLILRSIFGGEICVSLHNSKLYIHRG